MSLPKSGRRTDHPSRELERLRAGALRLVAAGHAGAYGTVE